MKSVFQSGLFRKVLASVVALIAVIYFILQVAKNIAEIPPLDFGSPSIFIAVCSIFLVVANIGMGGLFWQLLLRDSGVQASFGSTQVVFAISQFGKYLPGNVGQHVGRVVLAKRANIPVPVTLSTIFIEILFVIGVSAALGLLALVYILDDTAVRLQVENAKTLLAMGIVMMLFLPWLCIRVANRFFPEVMTRLSGGYKITPPSLMTAIFGSILFLISFLALGLALKLHSQYFFGVEKLGVLQFTGLFSIAWLAGYIMPGAPGGLGVRESMMLLLLSPFIGEGAAIGLSITLRLTTTLADGFAFIAAMFFRDRFDRYHVVV